MSHRDRFIFVQALGKPIVEAIINADCGVDGDEATEWRKRGIRHWCHFLYALAGELEPKERDDDQKRMHTQTFNKYRRMADKAISRDDSLAMVEIRDELTENKHWADFMRRLYTEQAKEVERLVAEGDRLAFEQDEDYLEMQE